MVPVALMVLFALCSLVCLLDDPDCVALTFVGTTDCVCNVPANGAVGLFWQQKHCLQILEYMSGFIHELNACMVKSTKFNKFNV